jgi:enoyl-CoA hydratase/carnithine racemase
MTAAGAPPVRLVIRGSIAHIILARPEKRNAITPQMAREVETAVDRLETDSALRVGVLSAEGEAAFCAGADLSYVARGEGGALATPRGGFAGFVRYPRRKPVIAAVHGYAVAGGLEIMLACDLVVAERTAQFSLPEVTRGVVAGSGVLRLASSLPRARALDIILTGRSLTAPEAAELGLVSRLVDSGQAVSAALSLAAAIAANAPGAVRESLRLANAAAAGPSAQTWELAAEISRRVRATADAIEGASAFLDRRDAAWTDQP